MKIRTFIVCEDLDVSQDRYEVTIKKMMKGIIAKSFPSSETLVFLFTFDEVEPKEKTLELKVYSNNEKLIKKIEHKMEKEQDAVAFKAKIEFPYEGKYYFKISCDGKHLERYPFWVIEAGERDEQ